ncbi:hypothetical protein, partial [Paraburkholderia heleia]|uniref:hypothetical protein n=1 Tax=Paraburkholderia heleia TaxID=634127 RepID=UPI002AB76220
MALLTAACGQKTTVLTEQENRVVTEAITELKTHCVGRYLIDLPGNMRSVGFAKLQGVMVKAEPKSLEQFNRDMKLRETELKATKSPAGYQFLYDSGKIHNVENSQYFVSLGNPFSSSDAIRVIETYKWDRGYQIDLNIGGTDLQHSSDRE